MELIVGNVFVRVNKMAEAGDIVHGHKHNFDHMTLIVRGKVHIRAIKPDGEKIERVFKAGEFCLILANVEHEITALMDDTLFHCIYSHRTPQGDVVEKYTGWADAYV